VAAEPKTSSPATSQDASALEAKQAKERARALFQKGDYAGALEDLERAQRLAPDPRLFWNIAACEKKLGRYAKAMGHVALYQSAATGLSDAEKDDAAQFLIAVRAYVGIVTVTANVDGTAVSVDGEPMGATPLATPIVLDEGDHAVRFVRDGYKTVEHTEHVRAGTQLRWTVELEPNQPAVTPVTPAILPRQEPRPEGSPSRTGPLLLGGAGLAMAATGGVLGAVTLDQASKIRDDCGSSCPPSRWEKYRTMQTVGDVLLVVGGAALAAGVVWWVLQPSRPTGQGRAAAWLAPAPGGVTLGGSL